MIRAVTDHQAIQVREIDPTPRTIGGTGHTQGQDHHTTGVAVSHLSGDIVLTLVIRGHTPLCAGTTTGRTPGVSPQESPTPLSAGAATGQTLGVSPQESRDIQGVFLPEEEIRAILAAFHQGQ